MEGEDKLKTLECLRGRLLAERGASRVANEEADQIANKVGYSSEAVIYCCCFLFFFSSSNPIDFYFLYIPFSFSIFIKFYSIFSSLLLFYIYLQTQSGLN